MGENYRHHRAHAGGPPSIIFVEVPAAGSPKNARTVHPPAYKRNQLEPWRPQQAIPHRVTKAQRAARFVDAIVRQEAEVRAFMEEARRHAG
jgi:hypothetical protein